MRIHKRKDDKDDCCEELYNRLQNEAFGKEYCSVRRVVCHRHPRQQARHNYVIA